MLEKLKPAVNRHSQQLQALLSLSSAQPNNWQNKPPWILFPLLVWSTALGFVDVYKSQLISVIELSMTFLSPVMTYLQYIFQFFSVFVNISTAGVNTIINKPNNV
jgi:hypothetical protein